MGLKYFVFTTLSFMDQKRYIDKVREVSDAVKFIVVWTTNH